jgi:uncharacterized protein
VEVSKTISPPAGRIAWFELPAHDTRRAQDFYGRLFGWRFEPSEGPIEYHMATEAGGAIMPSTGTEGPVVYFGVDDLESSMERVKELGGRVVGEPQALPNVGAYVQCLDTEQNLFSLWQAA